MDKEGKSLVGCLHGDMSQRERTSTLNGFRRGQCTVLVCTDVARDTWLNVCLFHRCIVVVSILSAAGVAIGALRVGYLGMSC